MAELKRIRDEIKELSIDQQAVLRLFYIENYSLKEISVILKISTGTVKSRLYHAREKLKKVLKEGNHEKRRKKIDVPIRKTLTSEEAAFYDEMEEQNLLGKVNDF